MLRSCINFRTGVHLRYAHGEDTSTKQLLQPLKHHPVKEPSELHEPCEDTEL